MKNLLRVIHPLVVYDFPQVVLAVDQFEARYVGLLVEIGSAEDAYLFSPVSQGRLSEILNGEIDLRPVFSAPEGALFVGQWSEALGDSWFAAEWTDEASEEWLPEEGFLVSQFLPRTEAADEDLVAEAVQQNRAVVHLDIGHHIEGLPPRIDASDLSTGLSAFQQLLKQALKRAIRTLDRVEKEILSDPDHYELEVLGFSSGSFRIHLRAKGLPDLFGGATVERAFSRIDAMTGVLQSVEDSITAVQENRGHLASAYASFLEFVKDADEPVGYAWSSPGGAVVRREILPDQAELVLEAIRQEKELGSEWVDLEGYFLKVNTKTGSWTVLSEEGREFSGSLHEEADDLLRGVVVEEVAYRLHCEEVLGEQVGSGRKATKLFLRRLSPLSE